MEMILSESVLQPKYARGTPCKCVGIEPHPQEPSIHDRDSIASDGCVVLHYLPKCIYVRVEQSTDVFLHPRDIPQLAGVDMTGVLAITPQTRKWKFTPSSMSQSLEVVRTQLPLLPQKQCTLHGVQGKTAEPGFIVHWIFPPRLSKESTWLDYYVSLSRPRSFSQLLSHGLPSRKVIEAWPPEEDQIVGGIIC